MRVREYLLAAAASLAAAVTMEPPGASAAASTASSSEVAALADLSSALMPVAVRARAARIDFSATVTALPSRPAIGTIVDMRTVVVNEGAPTADTIVQVDVYSASGRKVYHKDIRRQAFASGETRVYDCRWRSMVPGKYVVKVGTFSPDWRRNYYWNDSAKVLRVQ